MIRLLFAVMLAFAASAFAQPFPKGPITLVIPVAPGDATTLPGGLWARSSRACSRCRWWR
jgi:hypothetical protein